MISQDEAGAIRGNHGTYLLGAQPAQITIGEVAFTGYATGSTVFHNGFVRWQFDPVQGSGPDQFPSQAAAREKEYPQPGGKSPQGNADGDGASGMSQSSPVMSIEKYVQSWKSIHIKDVPCKRVAKKMEEIKLLRSLSCYLKEYWFPAENAMPLYFFASDPFYENSLLHAF
jgi:hypothetical protein